MQIGHGRATRIDRRSPASTMVGVRFHRPVLLRRLTKNPVLAEHAFGVRLGASLLATFLLMSVVCVGLLERNLAEKQVRDFGAAQRANVGAFEDVGRVADRATSLHRVDLLLAAVERRADAKEAVLVDQRHVIVAAAASNDHLVGTRSIDPPIASALTQGVAFEGRETDPGADRRDFEFVLPVNLPSGRYAYDVTFDHRAFDQQLAQVRHLLLWIDLLGILGGGMLFYLFGRHRLLRDHQIARGRATRDGLTDLPNHRAFQDEVLLAVASAERHDVPLALAMIDVDDFKRANDRFGHAHGDEVLKRVATELRRRRPGDRAFRVGDDEFALILTGTDEEGARVVAHRIREHLASSAIAVSIGLSAFRKGVRADTFCTEADSALYEAKRQGGDQAVHVQNIYGDVIVTSPERNEAVRRLIEERRLTTAFQPIWNLQTGALLGVEALSRPDPDFGLTGPAEAFDIAERIGRVHPLDVLCVESALLSVPPLPPDALLFINLSPLTLDLDANAPGWLAPLIERAGLPRDRVVIEVTERFGGRTEAIVRCLARLREQALKIAVDDVGTGNSGLEILRRIDAEFLKLDAGLVGAAKRERGARAILIAVALFARQTGAHVIAEGIEDEDALRFIDELNGNHELWLDSVVEGGQGYGLGRPSDMCATRPALLHSQRNYRSSVFTPAAVT